MKRDPLDAVFSDLVRERANHTCERCGAYSPEDARRAFHCSHFIGRGVYSLRWHPLNGSGICAACHLHLGANPILHLEWFEYYYGRLAINDLRKWSQVIPRFRAKDKIEMLAFYRAERKRLLAERHSGATGRLEFDCAPTIERALA
jgi:hypothetical protein